MGSSTGRAASVEDVWYFIFNITIRITVLIDGWRGVMFMVDSVLLVIFRVFGGKIVYSEDVYVINPFPGIKFIYRFEFGFDILLSVLIQRKYTFTYRPFIKEDVILYVQTFIDD